MKQTNMENVAWLGLDAHAHFSLLAWIDDQGRRRHHWRFPTSESQIIKHIHAVPAQTKNFAVEECGLARWIAQVAKPHVAKAVVCDPRENRHISHHHHKCDEEDGYALAHLLRLGALKEVWQPTNDARAVFKCAVQSYLDAVQRATGLKQQLKAHYRSWGVIPRDASVYSHNSRGQWLGQIRQEGVRAQLVLLYELLDGAVEAQSKARRLMVQLGRAFPEIALLRTVPGVGLVGAHTFVGFIQEPGRFSSASQLYRYCRLGIRDRSSDGKPLGYQKLDRQGHGVLKALSYRAWLQAMKRRRGPIYEFYRRSLERAGSEVHARLNTQRKVLLTLWVLWQNKKEFDTETFLRSDPIAAPRNACGS